jgi:hypothetical protein
MSLDLLLGPANAGKVDRLYERYLAHLDAGGDALLVVPTAGPCGGRSAISSADGRRSSAAASWPSTRCSAGWCTTPGTVVGCSARSNGGSGCNGCSTGRR